MKTHPLSPYCGCLPCSFERQRLAILESRKELELTEPKPLDGPVNYDPTCALCENGEEPGHEH